MDKDKIEAHIKTEIHMLMGYHVPAQINLTDNLYDNLGMDEIDCIELMLSLDTYYKIDMPEDQEQGRVFGAFHL